MNDYIYSIDTFVCGHCLNAGKTNSIVDAYRCFTEKLDLVESDIADSVVIFEFDDFGLPHIVATVNSFDC